MGVCGFLGRVTQNRQMSRFAWGFQLIVSTALPSALVSGLAVSPVLRLRCVGFGGSNLGYGYYSFSVFMVIVLGGVGNLLGAPVWLQFMLGTHLQFCCRLRAQS